MNWRQLPLPDLTVFSILPFGNGAERVLGNRNIGAQICGLDFNRHSQGHLFRAAQEGIVFSFKYGMEILKGIGIEAKVIRAGKANMFPQSTLPPDFGQYYGCHH